MSVSWQACDWLGARDPCFACSPAIFLLVVRDSVLGMLEFVFNLISWPGLVLVALCIVTRSDLCYSLGSLEAF